MDMINMINHFSNIQKKDVHIKEDIENKLIFFNVWDHFNIY